MCFALLNLHCTHDCFHVQQSLITFKIDAFQYMLLSGGRCELLLKQNRLEYLGQPVSLLGVNPAAID